MSRDDIRLTTSTGGKSRLQAISVRIGTFLLLGLLLGFVVVEIGTLWDEWKSLRHDNQMVSRTKVIGYPGIQPNISRAEHPSDWFHHEGEATLLWSGWRPGIGHDWFRVGRGEVDQTRISRPMGRDVVPAIDWPIVEVGGGTLWERIPPETSIAGLVTNGVASAYPLLLLSKVEVVNDEVEGQPLTIVSYPFRPEGASIHVYDPMHEGRRLTLGSSGYRIDGEIVLYDRATESLWAERDRQLSAFAGPLKGTRLRRIGRLDPVTWSSWRQRNPAGRLVVGADRSRGLPKPEAAPSARPSAAIQSP